MLRGLYQLGAGLHAATANQELAAENLANSATPGFRRQGMSFAAVLNGAEGAASPGSAAARTTRAFTNFTPGAAQQTGAPLDVALNGDGFFVLEGPRGPLYTRNGTFALSSRGELQSASGLRVQGQGGPIAVPAEARQIVIAADGTVSADGAPVGRLQLAQFANNQALRRAGPTLFEGSAPRTPEPDSLRVEQGYRETSNVQMIQEMVSMMLGMRQYEAAERALRALGDAVGNNTRPQG